MLPTRKKLKNGFSIVEAIVAIFILSIALSATMRTLVQNSNDANLVNNSFIASGLAQEGMEVVRNLRDNEWSLNAAWGSIVLDGIWSVQWDSMSLEANSNVFLKKDNNGFYNYSSGTDTLFKRRIVISSPGPGIEKKIVTTVSWIERGNPKILVVEEHLYNWR